jgi:hypothetical protein
MGRAHDISAANRSSVRTIGEVRAIEPHELENVDSADWLGVRDDFRNWLIHAA